MFGLARKRRVVKRRQRLLVEHRRAGLLEVAEPRPVGIAMTLVGDAVRRIEQPELCMYAVRRGAEAEEPAHGPQITTGPGVSRAYGSGLAASMLSARFGKILAE